ncbi:hypothetical protein [Ensifer adhaerens]
MPFGGRDIAGQKHDQPLAAGGKSIGSALDSAIDAVRNEGEGAARPLGAVAAQREKWRAGGAKCLADGADRHVRNRQRNQRRVLARETLGGVLDLLRRTVGIFDQKRKLATTHLVHGERRPVADVAFAHRFARRRHQCSDKPDTRCAGSEGLLRLHRMLGCAPGMPCLRRFDVEHLRGGGSALTTGENAKREHAECQPLSARRHAPCRGNHNVGHVDHTGCLNS